MKPMKKRAPAPRSEAKGGARIPENPFLQPTPENLDLSFLSVDDAFLVYAVDHYENRRRLREGIVFDHLNRREGSGRSWEELVAAASARFVPEPWMLPISELKTPGVINGIFDYFPISETTPEIYDPERRMIMSANKQRPWVILTTMNGSRHTSESFMHWVNTRMIPDIVKSAREMALHHFREAGSREHKACMRAGATRVAKGRIRAPSPHSAKAGVALSEKRLRARLHALACYMIRQSAAEGETMTRSLERYREALPAGVRDSVNLDLFIRRVDAVAGSSREEWIARLGDARRLHAALESGRIHIA